MKTKSVSYFFSILSKSTIYDTMNKKKQPNECYILDRDWKGYFKTVKTTYEEAKNNGLRGFATKEEAWEYLRKNPPIDSYS